MGKARIKISYYYYYSQLCLSRIRTSQIIAQVEGLFKSSSLYILLFLTSQKSKFLQVETSAAVFQLFPKTVNLPQTRTVIG